MVPRNGIAPIDLPGDGNCQLMAVAVTARGLAISLDHRLRVDNFGFDAAAATADLDQVEQRLFGARGRRCRHRAAAGYFVSPPRGHTGHPCRSIK
jgi:hypothetical protein